MKGLFCNHISHSEWDEFVENNKNSSIAHLYGWKEVIEKSYGHKSYYLQVIEKNELAGILPLVFINSRIFGRQLVSMPFLDYGGICVNEGEKQRDVIDRLLNGVLRLSKELKADCIDLRHLRDMNIGWETRLQKVTMIIELKSDENNMWKSLTSERRNRIRKSRKNNLEALFCNADAIDEFYEIFAVNMRDLGSPVHSKAFFINIMKVFEDRTKIILVKHNTKTIGAALCFLFKDTVSIPWVSSLRDYFKLYPNNILYWEAIKHGCSHGYKFFDFGRSSKGSGTFEFKRQWGAKSLQLFWDYYQMNNKGSASGDISNSPKYQYAAEIWKKLPISLSKIIGPWLRKYISN
ncbi:MAG: FemAB family XrtA/PEP-CTERM system-associated protein [Nitrospirota bacterium]